MTSILIVEDEPNLAEGLRFNLELEDYQTSVALDGESALRLVLSPGQQFDAIILDIMLPGIDGFEVASSMRSAGCFVPILMLTARSSPEDILRGFEAGADDYLPKPFDLSILIARLRGLLRRREWFRREEAIREDAPTSPPSTDPRTFSFAGKTIDFNTLEIHANGQSTHLTLKEAELLRYLIIHEGERVSRKALLEEVWGLREDTDTRAIDNFVVRLRRYVEDDSANPKHLLTVRGIGYKFIAEPKSSTDTVN
jgi:two-component system, OmpR family, alkaline phosphatase synthesis response regulator PhoP